MLDRDRVIMRGIVGQEFSDRVVHGQLALLGQQQDGHRCELLGHRT